MRDQRRIADKVEQILHDFGELAVLGEKFAGKAVHAHHLFRHGALRIDISVKLAPGALQIDKFDAADFNDAVAFARLRVVRKRARGFGVEDDLAHGYWR